MTTKNDLDIALKAALRAKDDLRKATLRMALAGIKLAEVDKRAELDDAAVIGVLQKEVKSRRESIADAERAKRADLVKAAEAEIVILEEFLPKAMSAAELEALVKETIAEVGASDPGDIGGVMKAVMPKVQGRAEGGQVSQIVRQLLQPK